MVRRLDAFDLDERLLATRIDLLAAGPGDVIDQILRGLVMMPAEKFTATATTNVACHNAQSANIIVTSLMLLKIACNDIGLRSICVTILRLVAASAYIGSIRIIV